MNFVKFLKTPFLTEHLWWLLSNVIIFPFSVNVFEKNSVKPYFGHLFVIFAVGNFEFEQ